jgi:hypothetical protein
MGQEGNFVAELVLIFSLLPWHAGSGPGRSYGSDYIDISLCSWYERAAFGF